MLTMRGSVGFARAPKSEGKDESGEPDPERSRVLSAERLSAGRVSFRSADLPDPLRHELSPIGRRLGLRCSLLDLLTGTYRHGLKQPRFRFTREDCLADVPGHGPGEDHSCLELDSSRFGSLGP
jgi:hypothetical protein